MPQMRFPLSKNALEGSPLLNEGSALIMAPNVLLFHLK